ncbi:DUF4262 domain-containing protein [Streptomyces sp. ST2-7A]|uniref:DUF4262 domain-containing protein n=1 Tax=Streptomyces sp. ST2-7A TaxID=2907214 RepID=UPI001F3C059E|nr:DUF4262 domain-containing protein [Streptomyces sp. ST2-7A]MCE7081681.1 DUF4262 domain-containing protein [Streptomyces sp. ST2-7A]
MSRTSFECRCVLCHDYGGRGEADELHLKVLENVRRYGWHVMMVAGDEVVPGFAYTIGLAHTHGVPEFAVFGLDLPTMHRMVNMLGDRAVEGAGFGDEEERREVVEGHRLVFKSADLRWYRTFFGRAIGFYRRPPIPLLQVTWADPAGLFPWEEQASPQHRESQPRLWLPPEDHPSGVWTTEM